VGRRVKCSAVNVPAVGTHEPLGTREHLLRGSAGEGQEQDSLWADTALEEVSDAIDEGSRFAGSRTGDYQQWPVTVCCGGRLRRVQLGSQVAPGRREGSAHPRGVNARGIDISHRDKYIPKGGIVGRGESWCAAGALGRARAERYQFTVVSLSVFPCNHCTPGRFDGPSGCGRAFKRENGTRENGKLITLAVS
jgi:hypothetical protein